MEANEACLNDESRAIDLLPELRVTSAQQQLIFTFFPPTGHSEPARLKIGSIGTLRQTKLP
jgi:hypothetical protein